MKTLATVVGVMELLVGLAVLATPSGVVAFLFGSQLSTTLSLSVARLAGVSIFSIGAACWLARCDARSRAMRGLIGAVLLYNAGLAGVLLYAGVGLGLYGVGFWPAALLHTALAVWCLILLLNKPAAVAAGK